MKASSKIVDNLQVKWSPLGWRRSQSGRCKLVATACSPQSCRWASMLPRDLETKEEDTGKNWSRTIGEEGKGG